MKDFTEKLKKLPDAPGVYLMKDAQGVVIYVGKAKNLKKRVSSYFRGFNSHSPKTQTLVVNIDDFEYIITGSEVEALILEGNLIKKYKPRFNVMLKDDKAYPYIKVTNERFPRVVKVRAVRRDGAHYFGPYSSNYAVNQTLEVIQRIFPIRSCKRDLSKPWSRACLNYHIKQCAGPCIGKISEADYQAHIDAILHFLSGHQSELIDTLTSKMQRYAAMQAFERAGEVRDQIEAIKYLTIKQHVAKTSDVDQDVIAAALGEDRACVYIFFVRNGILIGKEHFVLEGEKIENISHLTAQFILQFYGGTPYIPKEILLANAIDDADVYGDWLSQKRGSKVKLQVPKIGDKKKLVAMASENAQDFLDKYYEEARAKSQAVAELNRQLTDLLGLSQVPHRIEAYDISNIAGTYSVGSMVVYQDGQKKQSDYRRFKVKTIEGPNDYGSMMEVIYRRFNRGLEEQRGTSSYKGFNRFPDLILIDGGIGHVNAVKQVIEALGLNIDVAGMIKDNRHRSDSLYFEGQKYPLQKRSALYRFIYQIQEEVHRFAITYHRSLRDKQMALSVLDDIKGIGKVRKQNLLKHFKTITRIKKATVDELTQVEGVNEKAARAVYDYFRSLQ